MIDNQEFSYVDSNGTTHNDYVGSKLSLSGVNFTKIINDAMPGTNFEFSTTTNLAEVWGDGWNTWKDRAYIDVLKKSAVRLN